MSMQGHIEELKRRHQAVDRELHETTKHPSVDDTTVNDLKRRKLVLKDEIARLDRGADD